MRLAVPGAVPLEQRPTVMSAVLVPPAAPAIVSVPVVTPVAHCSTPRVRTLPKRSVLALRVLVPLPRLRVPGLVADALGPPPTRPGVTVPSPTTMEPAAIVLLTAS